jgi:serine/threonine-protein kinase
VSASPTDRFRRVDAVFDAVLDLPAADQTAFIDRACGDDSELRAEVIRLLHAYRRAGAFLESPAVEIAAPLLEDAQALATASLPEQIGQFRVVRAIGHGGMGQVFLGERADGQFEQRVALKLIQHGAAGLVRRFLEERRILARLEHPNIARLIDGGITADGLPYFAMELVAGEPIDRYCDAHDLSLDRRLDLFTDVCDAVTYAHQQLVIHRDLKPTNIFVTPNGQVKLLDFGIAKLLTAGDVLGDATRTQLNVMTPEFAAPEQVRGEAVSTATDVYALGVLLYILLSGERPYDVRGKSPAELERIICEAEPPRPSSKAAAHIGRRLRGDLDLIVMKALHKEKERRYQSPAALAQDLARLRAGHPINARPDSRRYRLAKFVARHRAGVAIASLLLLMLSGATARERVLRSRAETEARKAYEVENFLVGVFDVADPYAPEPQDGGKVTARELLDRGASRIDSTLVDQPAVQAELRSALGRVYKNLGLFDKATPLLERALTQRKSLYGSRNASVAESMALLGSALVEQDKYTAAEPLLRDALAQRRSLFGNMHAATAESIEHLATFLEQRNEYDAAEPLRREALGIHRSLFGDASLPVALSLVNNGLLQFRKGAYDEAEPLYRQALAIQVQRLGENHPETARTMQNLAQTQQMRGQLQEAEVYYRRALAAKRVALGNAHPSVTINLNNFGNMLARDMGRLDEGEALTREALMLDRQIFGEQHSFVAASLGNLGHILTLKGEFVEAEQLLQQSLNINRALFGAKHHNVALNHNQIGVLRYAKGDMEGAVPPLREAATQYRELLGEDHFSTVVVTINLARSLIERGDVVEGDKLLRGALSRLDPEQPRQRTYLAIGQTGLGLATLAQGHADDARAMLESALQLALQQFGKADWRLADAQLALGKALVAQQRYSEAEELLRAANATLQEQQKARPRLATQAAIALANLPGR